MQFDKITAPSLKDIFISRLQDAIISGEIKIGEKLPSERELSDTMQVSRAVVNSGIVELSHRGFVEIVPRQGVFVSDFRRKGNMETLNALMDYEGVIFSESSVRSILEIRKAAEHLVVERIIQVGTEEDFNALGQILGDLSEAKTPEEASEIAFLFWHELSYRCGDLIIPLTVQSFKKPVTTLWTRFCSKYGIEALVKNTSAIYSAICKRDLIAASIEVEESLMRSLEGDFPIYDEKK